MTTKQKRKAKKKIKRQPPATRAENLMLLEIKASGLPEPRREFRFHDTRRWRFDFAWPEDKVALEVEGGVWMQGRHVQPSGYISDCEKYTEAALKGWRVIRVTPAQVQNGDAVNYLKRALRN